MKTSGAQAKAWPGLMKNVIWFLQDLIRPRLWRPAEVFVSGRGNTHRRTPASIHVILTVSEPEGSQLRQAGHRGKGRGDQGKNAECLHGSNAFDQASEQILHHPYGFSSKLQPFELRLRLAFTGHFLLPSVASVRLTIVVICTAACSLLCLSRFRRYAFPTGRGDERRRWRIQRIESVPNHRVQQVINVVGRQ